MTSRLKLDALPPKVQTYLKAIATAYELTPRGSWANGRLWMVVSEEANRYEVDANEVLDSVGPLEALPE